MVETTITANGKTVTNPIIKVTGQDGYNPRYVYFIDNQTVGQPRHWYVGDGDGNVVVSDIDVVGSTTSAALANALTNVLTQAGYESGQHTSTVNDVPTNYNRNISVMWEPVSLSTILDDASDNIMVVEGNDGVSRVITLNGSAIVTDGEADAYVDVPIDAMSSCSDVPTPVNTSNDFSHETVECSLGWKSCSIIEDYPHGTISLVVRGKEWTSPLNFTSDDDEDASFEV